MLERWCAIQRWHSRLRRLPLIGLRLLALPLAAGLLVACDVEPEFPCWVEVRGDYRGHPRAEPVTPITLAEVTFHIDERLADYGVELRTVFTYGIDGIAVGLTEADGTQQVRRLLASTGRLEVVVIPADMPTPEEGTALPPLEVLIHYGRVQEVRAADAEPGPALDLELDAQGTQALAEWSRANVGRSLALVVDGLVIAAPTVQGPIEDGRMRVTGALDQDETRFLASLLSHGPLLLDLEEVAFESVDTPPCPPE